MAKISIKNLSKIYTDGAETQALRSVSLEINEGQFVAIMGPSGSGKSTLLHILGLLDRPTSGEYSFDNKSIENFTEEELARMRNKKMGFVFQSFNLLSRASVFENVKLPLLYSGVKDDVWDEMAKKAIDDVGLNHRMYHDSSQLSGGEKQRVAIARALVNGPEIIFADEPTGNLDSASGQTIMDIFLKLHEKKGHTIVLITHETFTAEYAERIIKMRDGKIESDNVIEERMRRHRHFIK